MSTITDLPHDLEPFNDHFGYVYNPAKPWFSVLDREGNDALVISGEKATEVWEAVQDSWDSFIARFPKQMHCAIGLREEAYRYWLDGLLESYMPDPEPEDDERNWKEESYITAMDERRDYLRGA